MTFFQVRMAIYILISLTTGFGVLMAFGLYYVDPDFKKLVDKVFKVEPKAKETDEERKARRRQEGREYRAKKKAYLTSLQNQ